MKINPTNQRNTTVVLSKSGSSNTGKVITESNEVPNNHQTKELQTDNINQRPRPRTHVSIVDKHVKHLNSRYNDVTVESSENLNEVPGIDEIEEPSKLQSISNTAKTSKVKL